MLRNKEDKTMKKWALRVLILAFLFSMLQLPALASLQDHNVSDVTIVQSTDESNLYFPDALTLPDGTLLVVYYKSASHKSDVGTIWGVKSTDNGQSWGQPFAVVDRSAEELQAREAAIKEREDAIR